MPSCFKPDGSVLVTVEEFDELLRGVKRDSGPGHPWIGLEKTKGGIMDRHKGLLYQATMEYLNLLAETPIGSMPEDPVDLVRQGFASPMRVFVKNEPHSAQKLATGRVRLIIMVPFHIVLAEMLIFGTQNNKEIRHWDKIPSKPGIGLTEDKHVGKVWNEVSEMLKLGQLAEADVSGYDFSLTEEMFTYDAKRRIELARGHENTAFARVVMNITHALCRSVFALSDGRMLKQETPGVMKSGRYCTSSTNSYIRVLLSHAVGSRYCIAMGDDSLEEYVVEAPRLYQEMGVHVKFYKKCYESFEFCSQTFQGGLSSPSNPAKMLFNLLNQRSTFEEKCLLFQQWSFEMRNSPEILLGEEILERSEWPAQNNAKTKSQA